MKALPGLGRRLLGATLALAVLTLALHPLRPEAGEPWVLRWLRVAVDHPLRMVLALGLVDWALRPGWGEDEGV